MTAEIMSDVQPDGMATRLFGPCQSFCGRLDVALVAVEHTPRNALATKHRSERDLI